MKKFVITIISNFNTVTFSSSSRNAKKHLRNNGGNMCIVKTISGTIVSCCKYSPENGFYYTTF